jgi:hypothetical protein
VFRRRTVRALSEVVSASREQAAFASAEEEALLNQMLPADDHG